MEKTIELEVRLAALEAAFVELFGGFYALLGEHGPALLQVALRRTAQDALPPGDVDAHAFQLALANLLAKLDYRVDPS